MTLSATSQRVSYAGNDVTTSFSFSFTLWAASEMLVYVRSAAGVQTLKTLTTHYTLSPSSYPAASGNVVFLTAPATGETVVLVRSQAVTQALDLVNGDPLNSDLLERRLDMIVGLIQNLDEKLGRTMLQQISAANRDLSLEEPSSAKDGYVVAYEHGTGFVLTAQADLSTVAVSAYAEGLLEDTTAAEALATLGLVGLQTIWIPAVAMTARTTNGPASGTTESATNKIMARTLDFDAATEEYAQFQIRFPKSWNEGTVTAYFLWKATNTGNVVWGLQGVAMSDDDVYDAAFGTAQTVTDGVTATTDLMVSGITGAITIAGTPAAGDLVTFQAYRKAADAADTCAVDALLVGVVLLYTNSDVIDD